MQENVLMKLTEKLSTMRYKSIGQIDEVEQQNLELVNPKCTRNEKALRNKKVARVSF